MNHHHDQRVAYYRERNTHAWSRGFCIGFVSACILIAAFMYGERNAYGNERPAPRHGITVMSRHLSIVDISRQNHWPRHWRTWLRIGMCEQPKRGISWHDVKTDKQRIRSIAWHQTYNSSFPGGLGLTRLNWTDFRPRSARHIDLMSNATPIQQLWAAERLWQWAERTYPGAGFTAWECSRVIGWTTSDPADALR